MADRVVRPAEIRDTRSLGEIVRDVLNDAQSLIRSELQLARTEMTEKARLAAKPAGLLAGAILCAALAISCLVVAGIAALALAMPVWLAALLMFVFLICIGAACYRGGRGGLRQIRMVPDQTVQSLREDVAWARQRVR